MLAVLTLVAYPEGTAAQDAVAAPTAAAVPTAATAGTAAAPNATAVPAAATPVATAVPTAATPVAPSFSSAGTNPPAAAPPPCRCETTPARNRFRGRRTKHFEFSFGSAELFSNQSVTDPAGIVRQRVIPITALNVMGEYLFHPRLAVMTQFLLPLEPESTLTDGELTLAYVPPALSGGLRATAFYVEAIENAILEGQFLALAGSTIGDLDGDAFYPTLGWRLHMRDLRGFTLYLGGSFAFRQNTTGLLYGVGHRF
jgi:hypothetical protein